MGEILHNDGEDSDEMREAELHPNRQRRRLGVWIARLRPEREERLLRLGLLEIFLLSHRFDRKNLRDSAVDDVIIIERGEHFDRFGGREERRNHHQLLLFWPDILQNDLQLAQLEETRQCILVDETVV